jgi:hypothetical protein
MTSLASKTRICITRNRSSISGTGIPDKHPNTYQLQLQHALQRYLLVGIFDMRPQWTQR